LEEFFATLSGFSTAVGIKVFIKEFPHIVGERQNFQVFGVSVKEKVTLVIYITDVKTLASEGS
jgi:hypothetical protein